MNDASSTPPPLRPRALSAPACDLRHVEGQYENSLFEESFTASKITQSSGYVEAVAATQNVRLPKAPYSLLFCGGVVGCGGGEEELEGMRDDALILDSELEQIMRRKKEAIAATEEAASQFTDTPSPSSRSVAGGTGEENDSCSTPSRSTRTAILNTKMVDTSTSPKKPNPLREAREQRKRSPSPPSSPLADTENLATFYMKKYQEQLEILDKTREEATRAERELEERIQQQMHQHGKERLQWQNDMNNLSYEVERYKSSGNAARTLDMQLGEWRKKCMNAEWEKRNADGEIEKLNEVIRQYRVKLEKLRDSNSELQGQLHVVKGTTSVPLGTASSAAIAAAAITSSNNAAATNGNGTSTVDGSSPPTEAENRLLKQQLQDSEAKGDDYMLKLAEKTREWAMEKKKYETQAAELQRNLEESEDRADAFEKREKKALAELRELTKKSLTSPTSSGNGNGSAAQEKVIAALQKKLEEQQKTIDDQQREIKRQSDRLLHNREVILAKDEMIRETKKELQDRLRLFEKLTREAENEFRVPLSFYLETIENDELLARDNFIVEEDAVFTSLLSMHTTQKRFLMRREALAFTSSSSFVAATTQQQDASGSFYGSSSGGSSGDTPVPSRLLPQRSAGSSGIPSAAVTHQRMVF